MLEIFLIVVGCIIVAISIGWRLHVTKEISAIKHLLERIAHRGKDSDGT